jgi:predicted RNA methylase
MSQSALFSLLDFSKVNAERFEEMVRVTATQSGKVNSIRLTSPLVVQEGISFCSSDSLMPPVVVPLATDIEVAQGAQVVISIQYESCSDWDRFRVRAEVA